MGAELIETARLYARTVAPVRPEWIERAGKHLTKHAYFDPHWHRQTAHVLAFEKVTLFGLLLVPKRPVHYGPIEPVLSRQLFIQHALVDNDFKTDHPATIENVRRVIYRAGASLRIRCDEKMVAEMEQVVGSGNVRLLGRRGATARAESSAQPVAAVSSRVAVPEPIDDLDPADDLDDD